MLDGPKENGPQAVVTLTALPNPAAMSAIHLVPFLPGGSASDQLDEPGFRKLMRNSRPLPASDPSLLQRSYSPWYSGSFLEGGVTYSVLLFRGGRGLLRFPNGTIGYFETASLNK